MQQLCNNHSVSTVPLLRHLAVYILFLLATLTAHSQSSVWWYPLGPMGATRFQSAPTQDSTQPVIRWRSGALNGSRVVLVGSVRHDSAGAQQIVGQVGNQLRILQSEGFLRDSSSEFSLPSTAAVLLTGLFNTAAANAQEGNGTPDVIGLGVTRAQVADPSRSLYGVLLDTMFLTRQQLWIERLTDSANQTASVYPIAAYTPPQQKPVALALVSQESYRGRPIDRDTMVNGLRRYELDATNVRADSTWSFVVAPRTYPQAPALALDPLEPGNLIVSPSTSAYVYAPPDTVLQPVPGSGVFQTQSNQAYSWLAFTNRATLREVPKELVGIPAVGVVASDVHDYVVRLQRNVADPERYYRLVTLNHDAQRRGYAAVYLRRAHDGLPRDQQDGFYLDSAMKDIGWSITQADVDGNDNSVPRPAWLFPNPGLEIVGARRRLDGAAVDTNRLYLFRYTSSVFESFANQAFNGELSCAGDLIADPLDKDEIVITNNNTVSILRLRPFNHPRVNQDVPEYFETLASYSLDARIVSTAIADIDGDASNDLIVVTELGTYMIGRAHRAPFGEVRTSSTSMCSGDTLSVSWQRSIAGGEAGMRIDLVRLDVPDSTVVDAQFAGTDQKFLFTATGLVAGRYRIRITDRELSGVTAMSDEFEIRTASIDGFEVPTVTEGDRVTIATAAHCAERLILEYSFDHSEWTSVGNEITVVDDTARVDFPMPCFAGSHCDRSSPLPIHFRFATPDRIVFSPVRSALMTIDTQAVDAPAVSPTSPRRRRLIWPEAAFNCDSVRIRVSTDAGSTWSDEGFAPRTDGSTEIDIDGELAAGVLAQVCCDDGCGMGLARFVVGEIGEANFIAPNPFSPTGDAESSAAIIYRLTREGSVTISIRDVARALVRTIVSGESMGQGLHRTIWDGRNDVGDIVADGTYICLIASSSGERIVLPLSVAKR